MRADLSVKPAFAAIAAVMGMAMVRKGIKETRAILGARGKMARAEGKVVGWVEREVKGNEPEEDRTVHDARVRFHPKGGKAVTFLSTHTHYLGTPPADERVTVEYNPGRPDEARVVEAFVEWTSIILLLSLGLLALAVAAGLLWDSFHPEAPTPVGPA